jgi:hypothetical protein
MFEAATTYGVRKVNSLVFINDVPALCEETAVIPRGSTKIDAVLVAALKGCLNPSIPVERNSMLVAYFELQGYLRRATPQASDIENPWACTNRMTMRVPDWYPGPTHLINLRRDVRTIPPGQRRVIFKWLTTAVCKDCRDLFGEDYYSPCWEDLQAYPKLCKLMFLVRQIMDLEPLFTVPRRIAILWERIEPHWGEVDWRFELREQLESNAIRFGVEVIT